MTTLALLALKPTSRAAKRSLQDPQVLHKTLMTCFPRTAGNDARREFGVLWRVEPSEAPTVLMQAQACPDLAALPSGYAETRIKSLDGHLKSLRNGQVVNFRVVLNPIRKSRTGATNRQRVVPSAERLRWASERVTSAGLDLQSPPTLTGLPIRHIERGERRFPIYATRVDGVAQIADVQRLTDALRTGVGHAKAWGCGLMTVLQG